MYFLFITNFAMDLLGTLIASVLYVSCAVIFIWNWVLLQKGVISLGNRVEPDQAPPLITEGFMKISLQAKKKLRILAAELDSGLFCHAEVINHFEKLLDRGIEIEIIAGPVFVSQSERHIFYETFKDRIRFLLRPNQRNIHHGTIVDEGKIVMMEDYHEPWIPHRMNYIRYSSFGIKPKPIKRWISYYNKIKETTIPLEQDEFNSRIVSLPSEKREDIELLEDQVRTIYKDKGYAFIRPKGYTGNLSDIGMV